LAELGNVEFVSLQKGPGSEQLQGCSFRHRFVACQPEIDSSWDFVETLSILAACDLVITSDTSVAHLAGALGRPTWVLLKRVPEWRWGLEGETTPWYRSSMRLFRQKRAGDWAELIGRVKKKLENLILEALPKEDTSL
jgi:ADP-heptose:LPS heptosyltransferase